MREDVRREWANRLLSGVYQQGTSHLCSINKKYCCLGVLAEVIAQAQGKTVEWKPTNNSGGWAGRTNPVVDGKQVNVVGSDASDPSQDNAYLAVDFLELVDAGNLNQQYYGHMNDGGMSFEAIAADIKQQVKTNA